DAVLLAVEVDRPVFLALELLDLQLALDDEAQCRALHPSRRQSPADLLPQQRRKVEADEVVERAARLLRVDELHRDGARMFHRILDGTLGDLVENHALELLVLQHLARLEDLRKMPGDGLALTVRVRGEQYRVRMLDGLGDGIHMPLVALYELVLHAEVVVGIDGAGLRHQIADVPVRGEDLEILAEILLERLRLRRRFDDEQMRGHGERGVIPFSFYNG